MARSAFSPAQIAEYLSYIDFSNADREHPDKLSELTALHQCQISHIPYENLSLHYRAASVVDAQLREHQAIAPYTSASIPLDPNALFEKIVRRRSGRGGYCFELAIFFHHILLALGYNVYLTGARIRLRDGGVPSGEYMGWQHCLNIVTLPGTSADGHERIYAVDVSFGGDGPVKPLPLVHEYATDNLGTQQVRLIYDHLPSAREKSGSASKLWIYQYRNEPRLDWNSYYAFPELEFLEEDLWGMSFFTSRWCESFQMKGCLVVKFISRDGLVCGKIMMAGHEVKRNTGGRTEVLEKCSTETERVEALRRWFDIAISEEESGGIRGLSSALPEVRGQR